MGLREILIMGFLVVTSTASAVEAAAVSDPKAVNSSQMSSSASSYASIAFPPYVNEAFISTVSRALEIDKASYLLCSDLLTFVTGQEALIAIKAITTGTSSASLRVTSGSVSTSTTTSEKSSITSLQMSTPTSKTLAPSDGVSSASPASDAELYCGAINTWYQQTADARSKFLSVLWAVNGYKDKWGDTLVSVIRTNDYLIKYAPDFFSFASKLDSCDTRTILARDNSFTLTPSGYARIFYTSTDAYYAASTMPGCATVGSGGSLNSNLFQTTIVSDPGAGPIVPNVSSPTNYMLASLEDVLSGGGPSGDPRTAALQNAQQTAFVYADQFNRNFFSRSLLQSIGVPQTPYLDRVAPATGIAPRRPMISLQELRFGLTSPAWVNYSTGAITIGISPDFLVNPISGSSNPNPLTPYANQLPSVCGEMATFLTENLIPTANGQPAVIHDETVVMSQLPFTLSGMFLGDAIEQIASALCAGLSTRNPTALLSPVYGAQGFGPFIYGASTKAARLAAGYAYNDGYNNYPFRFHIDQSLTPLVTAQVALEDTAYPLQGRLNPNRDGTTPPAVFSGLSEPLSTMDFGASVFTTLFMHIANGIGVERAWKIFLRAINHMGEAAGGDHTSWHMRRFAADMMAAANSLYGPKIAGWVEVQLLSRGFPTVTGLTVKQRIVQLAGVATGTTLRGQSGIQSSFASPQPGIAFANPTITQCNWFADRTPVYSGPEAPLYLTFRYSPFSNVAAPGSGDLMAWRQVGTLASGNNPNMDGALIASIENQPTANMTVFINSTSRADESYYRCVGAGLFHPASGFGTMNFDVRSAGYEISDAQINGFTLTMTKTIENADQITFRGDIIDYSSTLNGGPYVRDYSTTIDVSNLSTPIVKTGASFIVTVSKDQVMDININRTTGGQARGSVRLYMATNDIDTYRLAMGKSPGGVDVVDATSRASFLYGYPEGIWGPQGGPVSPIYSGTPQYGAGSSSHMLNMLEALPGGGMQSTEGGSTSGGDSNPPPTPLLYGTASP